MVKISIIIVTFNSEKYIGNCLESISKCFKDIGHEIIIVDNCSKDGTLDILNKRKDILLIRNGKNQGFAKACNKGARPASGKYLFFINPDIEFKDPIPEKIFVSLSKNSDVAGGGFYHVFPSGRIQRICSGYIVKPFDHFFEQLGLYALLPSVRIFNARFFPFQKYWNDHPAEFICGGCFLIKKEIFSTISGFDEKYFSYFEDMDICKRLKNKGYKLHYWGSMRIIHFLGSERKKITILSLKANYTSRYYYFKKFYSPLWLPFLWLVSNIGLLARFIVFIFYSLYKIQFYNIAKKYFSVFLSHLNPVNVDYSRVEITVGVVARSEATRQSRKL